MRCVDFWFDMRSLTDATHWDSAFPALSSLFLCEEPYPWPEPQSAAAIPPLNTDLWGVVLRHCTHSAIRELAQSCRFFRHLVWGPGEAVFREDVLSNPLARELDAHLNVVPRDVSLCRRYWWCRAKSLRILHRVQSQIQLAVRKDPGHLSGGWVFFRPGRPLEWPLKDEAEKTRDLYCGRFERGGCGTGTCDYLDYIPKFGGQGAHGARRISIYGMLHRFERSASGISLKYVGYHTEGEHMDTYAKYHCLTEVHYKADAFARDFNTALERLRRVSLSIPLPALTQLIDETNKY